MTRARVAELLTHAVSVLEEAGIDGARREALLLLGHAEGLDRLGVLSLGREALVEVAPFEALLRRRALREPLAFLLGRQGFWTLDLSVSRETLIPRADSEALIEALLAAKPERDSVRRILDLGTGTGCLLLAALSEYRSAWGLGVDVSADACRLAAKNARSNSLELRSAFLCGDWATAVSGGFDVILSNPPYIRRPDLPGLMPEVVDYEPVRALDGGDDGLQAYRLLMPAVATLLEPAGLCVFETGLGQAEDVAMLGAAAGLKVVGTRADLGGVTRAVLLEQQDLTHRA